MAHLKRVLALGGVLLLLCWPTTALGHSGGTDEDGGHIDHSTGQYHFHHGYPAHQHPDGVCPYARAPRPRAAAAHRASPSLSAQPASKQARAAIHLSDGSIPLVLAGGLAAAALASDRRNAGRR